MDENNWNIVNERISALNTKLENKIFELIKDLSYFQAELDKLKNEIFDARNTVTKFYEPIP